MSKQRLTWLLEQHLANNLTEQERQELLDLVKADADEELFKQVLFEMMQQESPAAPVNTAPWQTMIQDIVSIDKTPVADESKPARVFALYRWAAAAVVLLLLGAGAYYLMNRPRKGSLTVKEKIVPALPVTPVNKNELLLSDGSRILTDEVKNGQIAQQEKTTITKQDSQLIYTSTGTGADTYYNIMSTARTRQYEIVLPDGSRVWLNSASAIRFPASFTGKERSVELSGEAWFDVQHAGKIPFVIRSGNLTTSVMGTAFNIKAYPGEQAMTIAVQRGKVNVQSGNRLLASLEKGRQVKVMANDSSFQSAIDTNIVACWKKGDLYYKDERLADVIADLQRVFNVSIQINDSALKETITTASLNKKEGIRKILGIICRVTESRLDESKGLFIIE